MAKVKNWMSDLYTLFGIEEPEVAEEFVEDLEELRDRYEVAAEVGRTLSSLQTLKTKLLGINMEDFEKMRIAYMEEHYETLTKVISKYSNSESGETETASGEADTTSEPEVTSDEAEATDEPKSGEDNKPETVEPEVTSDETGDTGETKSGEDNKPETSEPEVTSDETTESTGEPESESDKPEVLTGEVVDVNESEPSSPFNSQFMCDLLNEFMVKENFRTDEFIFKIHAIIEDSIDPAIANEPYYHRKGWMYAKDIIQNRTGLDRETLAAELKGMDKEMKDLCEQITRYVINHAFDLFWDIVRLDPCLSFINPFEARFTVARQCGFMLDPNALVNSCGSLNLTFPDKRWDAGQGFAGFYKFYKEDIDCIIDLAEEAMRKGVFNRKELNPKGNYPVYYGSNYINIIGGAEDGYEFWRDEAERKYREFNKDATVNEAPQDTDADPVKSEHQQVEDEKPITVPAWSSPFEFDPAKKVKKDKKNKPKKK